MRGTEQAQVSMVYCCARYFLYHPVLLADKVEQATPKAKTHGILSLYAVLEVL